MWIWPGFSLVDAVSFTLEHMRRPDFCCEQASLFTCLSAGFALCAKVFFPSWLVDSLWDDIFTRPVPQQHPQWA